MKRLLALGTTIFLALPAVALAADEASAWAATQSTAASAHPFSGQPAIAKTGSASRIRALPASIGASRPGTRRGVV